MSSPVRKIPTTSGRMERVVGTADPCRVCGREVDSDRAAHIIEVWGGGYMTTPEDYEERQEDFEAGGASLGLQPVGPSCVKKIPEAYRVEV